LVNFFCFKNFQRATRQRMEATSATTCMDLLLFWWNCSMFGLSFSLLLSVLLFVSLLLFDTFSPLSFGVGLFVFLELVWRLLLAWLIWRIVCYLFPLFFTTFCCWFCVSWVFGTGEYHDLILSFLCVCFLFVFIVFPPIS